MQATPGTHCGRGVKRGRVAVRLKGDRPTGKNRSRGAGAGVVWHFDSPKAVHSFWVNVRNVPRRTEGRTDKQYERYYAALYFLALANDAALSYPLKVEEGESPDFMLTWPSGEITGLEVIRATDQKLQQAMTRAEKDHPNGYVLLASPQGYRGDDLEKQACAFFCEAIEKKADKLGKFRPASRHDLIVPDDTRMGAGDRRKVLAILTPWARELKQREPKLGKISIVASLDVLYDIGGESRIFPFVAWSNPEASARPEEFSDRVEYAGRFVAEQAVNRLRAAGHAVYFIDGRERLVKQTSDGRRFEVRVTEEGDEVTLRELPRR